MAEQSEKIRIAAPVFDDAELMISDSNGNIKLRIPAQTLPEIKKQSIPRALIAVALAAVVLVSLLLVMRSKKSLYGKTRYSPKLRSYIISNLKKGYTKQQIRNALLKNKYTSKEIEDAFRGIR